MGTAAKARKAPQAIPLAGSSPPGRVPCVQCHNRHPVLELQGKIGNQGWEVLQADKTRLQNLELAHAVRQQTQNVSAATIHCCNLARPKGNPSKRDVPSVRMLLLQSQPHLLKVLSEIQINDLQQYFDGRRRIEVLKAEKSAIEPYYASGDQRRLELYREIKKVESNIGSPNFTVPMSELLVDDILPKPDYAEETLPNEASFRTNFYRKLIAAPARLILRSGETPYPVFDIIWAGDNQPLPNEGGRIEFKHLISGMTWWNIDYQSASDRGLSTQLERYPVRTWGGQYLDLSGKLLGRIKRDLLWDKDIRIGNELSPLNGYYDDESGQKEIMNLFYSINKSRVIVKAPDGRLHLYTTEPSFKHADLKVSDKNGETFLLTEQSEVKDVQMIATSDDKFLKHGPVGWQISIDLSVPRADERFLFGLIVGDWYEDPDVVSTIGQIIAGVIPIVSVVGDLRDIAAGIYKIATGGKGGWQQTILAFAGFVPLFGDVIKATVHAGTRAVCAALKRAAPEISRQFGNRLIISNASDVARHFGFSELKAIAYKIDLKASWLKWNNLTGEKSSLAVNDFAMAVDRYLDFFGGHAGAVVVLSGLKWKDVAKALMAAGETGAKVGERMELWRVAQLKQLERELANALDAGLIAPLHIQRTGTPRFSGDLDVNFLGPDAVLYKNHAEYLMARWFGNEWEDLLDASFLVDPRRLHLFDQLPPDKAARIEKVMVRESEINVLARMKRDGLDEIELKRLSKTLDVPMDQVEKRANEITDLAADEGKIRRFELKMDAWHLEFLKTGDKARRAELAEEMAKLQSRINATNKEAYITPGGAARTVTRRDNIGALRKTEFLELSPAMEYMAALDNLAMLTHAKSEGTMEKQLKSLSKYADRLIISAGLDSVTKGMGAEKSMGARVLFDTIFDTLAVARKDPTILESGKLLRVTQFAFDELERVLDGVISEARKAAQLAPTTKGTDVKSFIERHIDSCLEQKRLLMDIIWTITLELTKLKYSQRAPAQCQDK